MSRSIESMSNEELIERLLSLHVLVRFHSQPNGLKSHLDHSLNQLELTKKEILSRMGAA